MTLILGGLAVITLPQPVKNALAEAVASTAPARCGRWRRLVSAGACLCLLWYLDRQILPIPPLFPRANEIP
jgi:hypothetical protein